MSRREAEGFPPGTLQALEVFEALLTQQPEVPAAQVPAAQAPSMQAPSMQAPAIRDGESARGEDPELEAVKIAVFVEDVFGVTLSDAELDHRILSDREAVLGLLRHHLDGR
jgi:hypothetical protein